MRLHETMRNKLNCHASSLLLDVGQIGEISAGKDLNRNQEVEVK